MNVLYITVLYRYSPPGELLSGIVTYQGCKFLMCCAGYTSHLLLSSFFQVREMLSDLERQDELFLYPSGDSESSLMPAPSGDSATDNVLSRSIVKKK